MSPLELQTPTEVAALARDLYVNGPLVSRAMLTAFSPSIAL